MNYIIKGMPVEDLKSLVKEHDFPQYRATQIYHWMYQGLVFNSDLMNNLPKNLKSFLNEQCTIQTLELSKKIESEGTTKFLFKTQDSNYIESVSMFNDDRHTICLSSQVGCNVDCKFCATGKMGFKKNLTVGEIIDQLILIMSNIDRPIHNIVFMGMGEPFLNYDNVIKAADIMHDSDAFNFGSHRITISTAGILPKINRFIDDKIKYHLAISLNATEDKTRDKLMPINQKWPIMDLINAAKKYNKDRRDRVTFEYVLIDSINDSISDAHRLAKLLKNTHCKLNIIPFNEIESIYKRPSDKKINEFLNELHAIHKGFQILVRWSKGTDINAGCGQLAIQDN